MPPSAASALHRTARLVRARAAGSQIGASEFTELVMRDGAGRPYRMASMHRQFHALADKYPRLVLMAHYESGKTETLIARTLMDLGRDPSLTFAWVSKSADQARKITRRLKEIIEGSRELREVYPHLRPGTPWGDTGFSIARPHGQKDLSVQCYGLDTSILGARISRLILDDVADWEVARTDTQRRATTDKVLNHMLTRVTEHGRVICCGVPFHVEDTISVLGRLPGWHLARFPVEKDDGTPNWPQRWSPERIAEARATLGPAAAARQLDLNAVSDADAAFIEGDLTRAIERGERAMRLTSWNGTSVLVNRSPAYKVILGVDPAVSLKPNSDLSAIVAIMVSPNGDREVLGCDAGRWPLGSIIEHIDRMNQRFAADVVAIETVAAQDWLAQAVIGGNRLIRVLRHTTGRGQMSLAWEIEELGRELRNQRWIFPSTSGRIRDPEVAALVRDMSLMTRSDRHVPDRVSALCMCRWAADQETRQRGGWFFLDTRSR